MAGVDVGGGQRDRLALMARRRAAAPVFDPRALIATLERHRVDYVVIGALARVLHGSAETTDELDISPSTKERNLQRLEKALAELAPDTGVDADRLSAPSEPVLRVETVHGKLAIVPEPAGTRGYDDSNAPPGASTSAKGLRPQVASTADLGRMLNTLRRDGDLENLRALRRADQTRTPAPARPTCPPTAPPTPAPNGRRRCGRDRTSPPTPPASTPPATAPHE